MKYYVKSFIILASLLSQGDTETGTWDSRTRDSDTTDHKPRPLSLDNKLMTHTSQLLAMTFLTLFTQAALKSEPILSARPNRI